MVKKINKHRNLRSHFFFRDSTSLLGIVQPCSRPYILLYKVFIWKSYIITFYKLIYYSISNCKTSAISCSCRKEASLWVCQETQGVKGYKMRWGRTESPGSQNTRWLEEALSVPCVNSSSPHALSFTQLLLSLCALSHCLVAMPSSWLPQPTGFCCPAFSQKFCTLLHHYVLLLRRECLNEGCDHSPVIYNSVEKTSHV